MFTATDYFLSDAHSNLLSLPFCVRLQSARTACFFWNHTAKDSHILSRILETTGGNIVVMKCPIVGRKRFLSHRNISGQSEIVKFYDLVKTFD